jgi:excisionase family DNA binding protein
MRADGDGTGGRQRHRTPEPPLTLSEAAAYLNVSQRFMRRLVAERRIAFHKLGHLLRFRAADLDVFLSAGRVEPTPSRLRR